MKKILLPALLLVISGISFADGFSADNKVPGAVMQEEKSKEPKQSKYISIIVDDKKIENKKGFAANSTGKLKVMINGAENLAKKDINKPFSVNVIHIHGNKPANPLYRYTFEEAKNGVPLATIMKGAKPSDRLIVEIDNTKEVELISIPLN